MTDEPREAEENEFENENGEVLPSREVMSVITTDPSDALLPAGDYTIEPVPAKEDEFGRLPVEPPAS